MILKADEIDYNEQTGEAEARGNVYYENFDTGEKLAATRVEYNLREQNGKFYEVTGSSMPKVEYRPGLLLTDNPFVFQGRWAEKVGGQYFLYDGFVTNCRLPKPTWKLTAPKFDIIPGQRAIAYKSYFKIAGIPVLYTPAFYKALSENPRRSGFLTPNIGRSNRFGWIYGIGYYWAINRSYDAMYRTRIFTQRGFSTEVDFRGKPRQGTDISFALYGVDDKKGPLYDDGTRGPTEGGYSFNISGKSQLGDSWIAYANINYLSSFRFRQAFTQSYNEAVFSAVNSQANVSKAWSYYSFHGLFSRHQFFQSTEEFDQIVIRKLPSFEFFVRDKEISRKVLPVWFSLDSSFGLLRRRQPLFETRSYTERFDIAPRLSSAIDWKGFRVLPSITFHGTGYGARRGPDYQVAGQNLQRFASDFQVELVTPSLEKIFEGPKWMGGRMKHVIEPRVAYRKVDGVDHFNETIRFDDLDILNTTSEGEFNLINRLFIKRGEQIEEILTWQVWQRVYFDPTFGGAVVSGQRNVFASTVSLTGYAFVNGPRRYSPVVSALRMRPWQTASVEWRMDYDPMIPRVSNSSVTTDFRVKENYSAGIGHSQVRGAPGISPNANQMLLRGAYGNPTDRGWRGAVSSVYDFREKRLQYFTSEASYISDCCGFSFQFRRLNFGTQNYNQYLFSFSVANIGSFGTLRKQEKLF